MKTAAGLLALALAVATSGSVRAADTKAANDEALKQLAAEAKAHFAVGELRQAAEKYQQAYKIKPEGALLFNAAQAYRLAGDNDKALLLYKNYLNFHPDAPNRASVESQIQRLKEAQTAAERARTNLPTTISEPGPAQAVPPPPPRTATPATTTTSKSTDPPAATPAPFVPLEIPAPKADPADGTGSGLTSGETAGVATRSEEKPVNWLLWGGIAGGVVLTTIIVVAASSGGSSTPWRTHDDFGPGR